MQFLLDLHEAPESMPEEVSLIPLRVAGKSSFSEGANLLQTVIFGKAMVRDVPGRRVRLGISLEYSVTSRSDSPYFARGELKNKVIEILKSGKSLSIDEISLLVGIRDGITRPVQQVVNTLVYQKVLKRNDGKPVRFTLKS